MIKLRDYREEDYLTIQKRHFDALAAMNFPNPTLIAKKFLRGIAYTLEAPDGIIASGGIILLWKGVGESWVITSNLVKAYPLSFVRVSRNILSQIVAMDDIERIQTTVHKDHITSQRWMEKMGFINEGLMRKFLGGEDYYRYALVKEG